MSGSARRDYALFAEVLERLYRHRICRYIGLGGSRLRCFGSGCRIRGSVLRSLYLLLLFSDVLHRREHEFLLYRAVLLGSGLCPVDFGLELEFVDEAVVHEGVLHREINRIRDRFLVREAHLSLCGVDIDVHRGRREVYHQHTRREFSGHYHVAVGIFERRRAEP